MSIFPGENRGNAILLAWHFYLINDSNSSLTKDSCFDKQNQQNVNWKLCIKQPFLKMDIPLLLID